MQGSSLSEAMFTEEETKVSIENIDVECSGLKKGMDKPSSDACQ